MSPSRRRHRSLDVVVEQSLHSPISERVADGVHGLANSIGLNCTGPVDHGRKLLSQVLQGGSDDIDAKALTEEIFSTVLTDAQYFIDPADYCTRSSAVLLIDRAGKSHFLERPRSTDSKRADIWMTNSCVISQKQVRHSRAARTNVPSLESRQR